MYLIMLRNFKKFVYQSGNVMLWLGEALHNFDIEVRQIEGVNKTFLEIPKLVRTLSIAVVLNLKTLTFDESENFPVKRSQSLTSEYVNLNFAKVCFTY